MPKIKSSIPGEKGRMVKNCQDTLLGPIHEICDPKLPPAVTVEGLFSLVRPSRHNRSTTHTCRRRGSASLAAEMADFDRVFWRHTMRETCRKAACVDREPLTISLASGSWFALKPFFFIQATW